MSDLYEVPMKLFPYFQMELTIVDRPFIFTFEWNTRCGFWFVSIEDREQNPIITGVKLTPNYPFLDFCISKGRPSARFFVVSKTNDPLTYTSFSNGDASVVYEY